jgi:hypothetical protein
LLNLFLASRDSQTIDEGAHLAAGYSYVTTNDWRLNPEHPSLFKLLAGTAIIPLNTKPAKQLDGWNEGNQWPAGKDLIYNSNSSARQILLFARMPSIVITVLLIYTVFLLARRLGGEKVGLFAAGLFALDPTLNAHGHLITNDVLLALGATVFLLGALNYWATPNKKHLFLFALATLLIVSTKFSGLTLLPVAAVIVIIKNRRHVKRMFKHLGVAVLIVFFGVWLQYGFKIQTFNQDIASTPASDPLVARATNYKQDHPSVAWVYKLPVPAYPYIRGVATLILHNSEGHPSYLYGNRDRHRKILYFPIAMAIKLPIVIIGSVLTALLLIFLKRFSHEKELRKNLLILLSFAGIFIVTAIAGQINIGVRHVFGAWPFIYIAAAIVLYNLFLNLRKNRNIFVIMFAVLLLPAIIASLRTPIAYQNEFGEGLEQFGHKPVLIDSNRDWAQDLYRLNDYLGNHGVTEFGEGVFSNVELSDVFAGKTLCTLEFHEPSCQDNVKPPCLLAISDTVLWLDSSEYYQWVKDTYYLTDRVGGSISIYSCRN